MTFVDFRHFCLWGSSSFIKEKTKNCTLMTFFGIKMKILNVKHFL